VNGEVIGIFSPMLNASVSIYLLERPIHLINYIYL